MTTKFTMIITLFSLLFTTVLTPKSLWAATSEQLNLASNSTVHIVLFDNNKSPVSSGSGSIVTESGIILTNSHVVDDNPRRDGLLLIRVPKSVRLNQYVNYWGRVLVQDRNTDLALVQIESDQQGNAVDGRTRFTPISIGNAGELNVGDELYAIGYPDIAGSRLVVTSGMVAGFAGEREDEWILSDVVISNGHSGGTVINQAGELVAIPTQVKSGEQSMATMAYLRPATYLPQLMAKVTSNQPNNLGRHDADASIIVEMVGQAITKVERATVNGRYSLKLKSNFEPLFVDAHWQLYANNQFRLDSPNNEDLFWEGQWSYDEAEKQIHFQADSLNATVFSVDDKHHIYVELNFVLESGDEIEFAFFQRLATFVHDADESVTLEVKNDSDVAICYIYISPSTDTEWGSDWLNERETVAIGKMRSFTLPTGTYDLLAKDCKQNEIERIDDVELDRNTTWNVAEE